MASGRSIGKQRLFYIPLIVTIGVTSSLVLDKDKIAAVMGLIGASLKAFISMFNVIAGENSKKDKNEFDFIKHLIDKLDKLYRKEHPMRVKVECNKVTFIKCDNYIITSKG